jgi:hypothetical protein
MVLALVAYAPSTFYLPIDTVDARLLQPYFEKRSIDFHVVVMSVDDANLAKLNAFGMKVMH